FIMYLRSCGLTAHSDCEIYRAFDLSYDYDCYGEFKDFLYGKGSLQAYADAVNRQEYTFPDNYVKLRFLENHDQTRARFFLPDISTLKSMTAFMFFQKGMALVYCGQEMALPHLPSLFDKDTVDWNSAEAVDLSGFIAKLARIKRMDIFTDSVYRVRAVGDEALTASHEKNGAKAVGVFPLRGQTSFIPVDLPDGTYSELISGAETEAFRGGVICRGEPMILIGN
ncbi:MAG: alpha-amylase, partial [Ruminococcus sp.]|nr:alpha-amylase [Ruminococcus sp.]